MIPLSILILAGGRSSRMGAPKHLLPFSDKPLYLRLIQILHEALPGTEKIYLSVADRSILDEPLRNGVISFSSASSGSTSTSIKLETILDDKEQDIGPAAGLLSAHHFDSTATWLVIACDYPLLQVAAVHQLIESYEAPVTCFQNANGFSEPLLGIWSPQSLQSLEENVMRSRTGPSYTVGRLSGKLVTPVREEWLVNVNTKQEWDHVKTRME